MATRSPTQSSPATRLDAARTRGLRGVLRAPRDKSVSHRALMFGALATGETQITGLLESEDVLATARAMEALGADVRRENPGAWRVSGAGALREPAAPLDFGNSGTGCRLVMGMAAGADLTATFIGDASLSRRPMARVLRPLAEIGAQAIARAGGRLPLTLAGARRPKARRHAPDTPSAQVKSAILLASLQAEGQTIVVEHTATRDHTERMLRAFGADLEVEAGANGGRRIALQGPAALTATPIDVPGDPSSAAFPLAAALITPEAEVTVTDVGVNPLRAGFYETVASMGAMLDMSDRGASGGEPRADFTARTSELVGVDVPAGRAASMIDEYPILAVLAACARGTSRMRGLAELRVKESDRLAAVASGLAACGVEVAIEDDDLLVTGAGEPPPGGATIDAHGDHRIAMAFLVFGLATEQPIRVLGAETIATSWPDFADTMCGLGAAITEPQA